MTQKEERIVWIAVIVILIIWWLRKRGGLGLGFGFSAGGVTGGASIGTGPAPTAAGPMSGGTAAGGGCCCAPPPKGPITGNFGDYAQQGGAYTLRVPVSWINDATAGNDPGWTNVTVGG